MISPKFGHNQVLQIEVIYPNIDKLVEIKGDLLVLLASKNREIDFEVNSVELLSNLLPSLSSLSISLYFLPLHKSFSSRTPPSPSLPYPSPQILQAHTTAEERSRREAAKEDTM